MSFLFCEARHRNNVEAGCPIYKCHISIYASMHVLMNISAYTFVRTWDIRLHVTRGKITRQWLVDCTYFFDINDDYATRTVWQNYIDWTLRYYYSTCRHEILFCSLIFQSISPRIWNGFLMTSYESLLIICIFLIICVQKNKIFST